MSDSRGRQPLSRAKSLGFSFVIVVLFQWMALWLTSANGVLVGSGERGLLHAALGVLLYGVLIAATILLGRRLGVFYKYVPFGWKHLATNARVWIILCWSLFLIAVAFIFSLIPEFGALPSELTSEKRAVVTNWYFAGLICVVVILAPLLEEFAVRGLALSELASSYPKWLAVIISSGFWMVAHLEVYPLLFALGILFASTTFKANSLTPAIAGHMAYNLFTLLFLVHPP